MALVNNLLGTVSGTVGGNVYKVRDGKTYVSRRPGKVTVSQSPDAIAGRATFKNFSQLFAAVKLIPLLKPVWEAAKMKRRHFQGRFYLVNYSPYKPENKLSVIRLVPEDPSHFGVDITELSLGEGIIRLTVVPAVAVTWISDTIFRDASVQGILELASPVKPGLPSKVFLPLSSANSEFHRNAPMEFEIRMDSQDNQLLQDYTERNLLMNLAVFNSLKNIVYFSKEASLSC